MSSSLDFKLKSSECVENDIVSETTKPISDLCSGATTSSITDAPQLLQNIHTSSTLTFLPQISTRISAADDDVDDCPTTPTSAGNRIPEIGPCPTTPMKPKSKPTLKRKLLYSDAYVPSIFGNNNNVHTTSSSNNVTRLLDFSKEVESMFPSPIQVNFGRKIKKARSI